MIPRPTLAVPAIAALLAALALTVVPRAQTPGVDALAVQLLAFNDFHGNLEPPVGSDGRIGTTEAGGAEYLATHLKRLEAQNPNTLVVSAGDIVGASPLLSGMFHDEPAIESLNAVGLDVSSVGNHEFDNGWQELLRHQQGGCHPADGCQDGTPFEGAKFSYLAANVLLDPRKVDPAALAATKWGGDNPRTGPVLPAYVIKEIGGVRIGFIGMTLKLTGNLVMPAGVNGLTFQSEAETANKWVQVLKKQSVRTIVVLIHEGGVPASDDYNGCPGVSGPILKIADRMSDDVDVIVSGHTHRAYICTMGKKLVTSAAAFGRLVTTIDLQIDRSSGKVLSKKARNVIVTRDVPKDPAQTAIIEHYRPFYTAVAVKPVGTIAHDLTRAQSPAGESVLGNIVADATLEFARAAPGGGADIAFMNPDGIRADLKGTDTSGGTRPISFADASSVLPFRNRTSITTMTGAMIKNVLEQQFDNPAPGMVRMMGVSDGFSYAFDAAAPKSKRVDPASITLGGRPVMPKQKYRVAVNEYLLTGGDAFSGFLDGEQRVIVGMDLDALIAYFEKHSPVQPPPLSRVRRVN